MTRRSLFAPETVLFVVLMLGIAGPSVAQDYEPEFWGTGTNVHFLSAEEFVCSDSAGTCSYYAWGDGTWCSPSTFINVYATLRLPVGSLIQSYRVFYEDDNVSLDLAVRLYRAYQIGSTRDDVEIKSWVSSGTPGITAAYVDVDPDHEVFYRYFSSLMFGYNSYYYWVTLPGALNVKFRGVAVYWNRQISPAPASQTFPDVAPGYWAFQEIEALAASGITSGFPDGTFRPTEPVTRAQMATFLARALGLHFAM